MKNNIKGIKQLTDAQINDLIKRYFNAETTVEEEAILKCAVAGNEDARYDEIRAVLGYVAVKKSCGKIKKVRWGHRAISIAAMMTVVIGIGLAIFALDSKGFGRHNEEDVCYAYVQGKLVEDPAYVMDIMQDDLSNVRSAADETDGDILSQINDVRDAIKDVGN